MLPRAAFRALRASAAPTPFLRASPRAPPLASASPFIRSYAKGNRNNNRQQNRQAPVRPDIQPEFDEAARPERNTAPHTEDAIPGESPAATPNQKPLPDLRHGIPSTFAEEFAKQQSAETEKGKAHHPINITEDPDKEPPESHAHEGGRGGKAGELPKSAYETSTDRRRMKVSNLAFLSFLISSVGGVVYWGMPWTQEEDEKGHADIPNGWTPTLMWQRAKARFQGDLSYFTDPVFPKLLPDMDPAPPYTLVISLEDMLVHSEWTKETGWRLAKRPGVDYFLRYLSQYYELVIFTSQRSQDADPVIRKLDPFRVVMWPLFREATRYEGGEYIKDLSYLNRDLSKVILIDTNPAHAKLQPENAIILPKWTGQPRDKNLVGLIPFLEYVATMGVEDVRTALKSFEGKDIPTEFALREAKAREAFNKQLAEEQAKKPKHSAGGWLMGALGLKDQNQGLVVGEVSAAEGFKKGKMLSDQIRERGQANYEAMEKEIRENGEKWLKEMQEEEKRLMAEQMKSMKGGAMSWFTGGGKKDS